jgi:type II secretory pathway pseudopilin PulG
MKFMKPKLKTWPKADASAFTLVEAVVAMALGTTMLTALYGSFALGFADVQIAREDLRATQILTKRIESLRVCSFAQITNTVYNPTTFTDCYDPRDQAAGGGGTTYQGTLTASVPPVGSLPEAYRTNMLLVTAGVSWTSGKVPRTRSLRTYVARKGIEDYVSTGK